jgi:hypothetical protein
VQKDRDPAQAGLPRIGSSVVRILAAAACSRTRPLDLRRKLEQQVLRSASPMGSRNCGGSSEVTPPIIESISAVIAHSSEGAASADQDKQAQAVSLFITNMLARRLESAKSNGVTATELKRRCKM